MLNDTVQYSFKYTKELDVDLRVNLNLHFQYSIKHNLKIFAKLDWLNDYFFVKIKNASNIIKRKYITRNDPVVAFASKQFSQFERLTTSFNKKYNDPMTYKETWYSSI